MGSEQWEHGFYVGAFTMWIAMNVFVIVCGIVVESFRFKHKE